MKKFVKTHWKTILFFASVGIIGGFFTGIYVLDSYPAEVRQQMADELSASGLGAVPVNIAVGLITAAQSAGYGLFLGTAGIWLGIRTGLYKGERTFEKRPLLITAAFALAGGLMMILPDMLFFGPRSEMIMASYANKPTVAYMLASVTYGAVTEEVMLRLFAMSLAAFILHKLFARKSSEPTAAVLIAANIVTAVLFGVGHLPATVSLLGSSPLVIIRCLLLNGGMGLIFGWLYRKHGLRYAMLAHGGCHIVSKLIWILFI